MAAGRIGEIFTPTITWSGTALAVILTQVLTPGIYMFSFSFSFLGTFTKNFFYTYCGIGTDTNSLSTDNKPTPSYRFPLSPDTNSEYSLCSGCCVLKIINNTTFYLRNYNANSMSYQWGESYITRIA